MGKSDVNQVPGISDRKFDFYLREDEAVLAETIVEALLQERLIEARESLFTIGLIGVRDVIGEEFITKIQDGLDQ